LVALFQLHQTNTSWFSLLCVNMTPVHEAISHVHIVEILKLRTVAAIGNVTSKIMKHLGQDKGYHSITFLLTSHNTNNKIIPSLVSLPQYVPIKRDTHVKCHWCKVWRCIVFIFTSFDCHGYENTAVWNTTPVLWAIVYYNSRHRMVPWTIEISKI
jgi:hypothetical protein